MAELDEVTLRDAGSVVTVVPARGGLVTRFDVGERRVLYLDLDTLRDPAKNVRGGIPVLFPSPGKLQGDAWSHAGRSGSMKQHGFARNLPWQATRVSEAVVTLSLVSNDETRAQYPWDFRVEQTLSLAGPSLRLSQTVSNRSSTPMPFGFGFHPYFFVPDAAKRQTTIATQATGAFDNVAKQTIELSSIDLTRPELDLFLIDHGSSESELRSPLGTVRVSCSPEYTHWVIWTLAGKDFVCLEPWTSPGNALNDARGLLLLAPGESRTLWIELAAEGLAA